MHRYVLVAVGGILGSLGRHALSGAVQRLTVSSFPYGTMLVNLLGSFLFGIVWGLLEDRITLAPEARLLLLTGFMGSLTTFSTLTYEGLVLLQSSMWLQATCYIAGQVVAGIVLVWLGIGLGRLV